MEEETLNVNAQETSATPIVEKQIDEIVPNENLQEPKQKRGLGMTGGVRNYVPNTEAAFFILGMFFVAAITGLVNSYQFTYLNDVVFKDLDPTRRASVTGSITTIYAVIEYVMSFLFIFIIDRTKTKYGRFRPYGLLFTIPTYIVTILFFFTPGGLVGNTNGLIAYFIALYVVYGITVPFLNATKNISNVITPNDKERTKLITWRDILCAIGNSAPLLIYMIVEALYKKDILIHKESSVYLITAIAFAIVGGTILFLGMSFVRERIVQNVKKRNPFKGMGALLKERNYLVIGFSEFIKNVRTVQKYSGIYLAVVLLGSKGKYLWLGLPTAIGTFVGMIIIKLLLKKFEPRTLYICSGIYSFIANFIAFGVGIWYFKTGYGALQILFIAVLFLIGLQYGASNLLPAIFNADVLDYMELKTGQRLDCTIGFTTSTFSKLTSIPATFLAAALIIKFVGFDYTVWENATKEAFDAGVSSALDLNMKIKLLGCYTLTQGFCMLLCGIPYFWYNLTGEKREKIMAELAVVRKAREEAAAAGGDISEEADAAILSNAEEQEK